MKKDDFLSPGWEAGGVLVLFLFSLGFCFSHVYSARSVEGRPGKRRTGKGADGDLDGPLRGSAGVGKAAFA